ncbi:MAG: hypothetical protein ACUVQ8_01050 [Nitrososphaeria archaeon]
MPSETIEGAWEFTFYIFFGVAALLLLSPVSIHLYSTCQSRHCQSILTSVLKVSEELEEGMTVRLSIANAYGKRLLLATSGTEITLYMEGHTITASSLLNMNFYDTSLELEDQLLISKIDGKILVRGR